MSIKMTAVGLVLFCVSLHAQERDELRNHAWNVSVGGGKIGNSVGPRVRFGFNATRYFQPYVATYYSWHSERTNGGTARVREWMAGAGFDLKLQKKILGVTPLVWLEAGYRRGSINFSDPAGDVFRKRNSGLHLLPGIGIEKRIKHGFAFEGRVGRAMFADRETSALLDIQFFGNFAYHFGGRR